MIPDEGRSRLRTRGAIGIVSLIALLLVSGCGDSQGVWPRYKLERAMYEARQQVALAGLQDQSGQIVNRAHMREAYDQVVSLFKELASDPDMRDSAIFAIGGEALMQLADLYLDDSLFDEASNQFEYVVNDDRFQVQYHRIALMGLGRLREQKSDYLAAATRYRNLLESFYPPFGGEGVNKGVLQLPNRLIAMAKVRVPDSLAAWEEFAKSYYTKLAADYPGTQVGMAAIGELAKTYTQKGEWETAIQTLETATDTSGAILPPYWIDIGEISSDRLGDTARALETYAKVSETFPDSPFRVDADLKRVKILMARKQYASAREVLAALKKEFSERPAAILPAQLLYAIAFESEGNWERAKNEYLYLITTYPESIQAVEAALAIAHHFVETNETGREAEWYNRADELAAALTDSRRFNASIIGSAMDSRVEIAVEQKQWDDASDRLSDIVKAFTPYTPAGAVALIRLGWLDLRERADTAGAADAWQRFLKAYPDHPQSDTLRQVMDKWPSTYKQDLSS